MAETSFVRIERAGRSLWRVSAGLWLSRPVDEVFGFFGDAANLNLITPPWLDFRILTPLPVAMGKGTRINYVIRLHGFPMTWKTEIAAWEPEVRFIDRQIRGPYRQWIHEHRFVARDGGTWCEDTVDYIPPLGSLVNRWFVEPDVRRIFHFRQQRMSELFAPRPASLCSA